MVPRHNGVRTNRYKLIHFYQFDEWEFYDLQTDPDELQNQYANPEYAPQISELKIELEKLIESVGDDSDMKVQPSEWQQKFRATND